MNDCLFIHPFVSSHLFFFCVPRYGKLIRTDIPAMKPGPRSIPYAFVEYRSDRDAEAAYKDMHGHYFDGMRLRIEVSRYIPLYLLASS
jgi:splicing factor, arginine/serine-rich 2